LNLEVEVQSRGGSISIQGDCVEEAEAIQRVVWAVPGVTGLTVDTAVLPPPN
jgi:osmotically-inducible protein OsmY